MFQSKDGLNFHRNSSAVSKTLEVTLEAEEAPKKGSTQNKVKVGVSVISEHTKKEKKMTDIRSFLASKNSKCCSRGANVDDPCSTSSLCFNVFKDVAEQEAAIYQLRNLYFAPNVSKKKRRSILLQEMKSMIKASKNCEASLPYFL